MAPPPYFPTARVNAVPSSQPHFHPSTNGDHFGFYESPHLIPPRTNTLPNHCGRLKRSQYHPQSHSFPIRSPPLPSCTLPEGLQHTPPVEIIYQNCRGRPPLAYCCHWVLVVGCSDLFPHLDAHQAQSPSSQ